MQLHVLVCRTLISLTALVTLLPEHWIVIADDEPAWSNECGVTDSQGTITKTWIKSPNYWHGGAAMWENFEDIKAAMCRDGWKEDYEFLSPANLTATIPGHGTIDGDDNMLGIWCKANATTCCWPTLGTVQVTVRFRGATWRRWNSCHAKQ